MMLGEYLDKGISIFIIFDE